MKTQTWFIDVQILHEMHNARMTKVHLHEGACKRERFER